MYTRTRYARDPYWLTVKYPCKCAKCGQAIAKGEDGFYYPSNRSMYCKAEACGGDASRDFESCAFDEAVYTGNW